MFFFSFPLFLSNICMVSPHISNILQTPQWDNNKLEKWLWAFKQNSFSCIGKRKTIVFFLNEYSTANTYTYMHIKMGYYGISWNKIILDIYFICMCCLCRIASVQLPAESIKVPFCFVNYVFMLDLQSYKCSPAHLV